MISNGHISHSEPWAKYMDDRKALYNRNANLLEFYRLTHDLPDDMKRQHHFTPDMAKALATESDYRTFVQLHRKIGHEVDEVLKECNLTEQQKLALRVAVTPLHSFIALNRDTGLPRTAEIGSRIYSVSTSTKFLDLFFLYRKRFVSGYAEHYYNLNVFKRYGPGLDGDEGEDSLAFPWSQPKGTKYYQRPKGASSGWTPILYHFLQDSKVGEDGTVERTYTRRFVPSRDGIKSLRRHLFGSPEVIKEDQMSDSQFVKYVLAASGMLHNVTDTFVLDSGVNGPADWVFSYSNALLKLEDATTSLLEDQRTEIACLVTEKCGSKIEIEQASSERRKDEL